MAKRTFALQAPLMIKPYSGQGSKTDQVEQMFDNIAPTYDFLNHFLSLGIDKVWRRKAISLLEKNQPKFILDVATGTADFAIAAAKLKPQQIIGIDLSTKMLDIGREKLRKRKLDQLISLESGNVEELRFEDNTFDAVTVAYGVRNFERVERGLGEINRVLKLGGQLIILEFSKPKHFPIKQLYNAYFHYILPTVGNWLSKDKRAYSYLPESVKSFPEGDDFLIILQKTGFTNALCQSLLFGISSIYSAQK